MVKEHEEQLISEDILNLNHIANSISQHNTIFGSFWTNNRKLSFDHVKENAPTFKIVEKSQSHQLVKVFTRLVNIYVAKEILAFSPSHAILVNQELPNKTHPFIELCHFLRCDVDLTNIHSFRESIHRLSIVQSQQGPIREILEDLAAESIQYPVYYCRGDGISEDVPMTYTHCTRPLRSYMDLLVHRLLLNSINKIKMRITPNTLQLACKHSNNIIQKMKNISFQIQLSLLSFGLKKVPIKGDCTVLQFDENSILVFSPELWLKYRIPLSPLEYELNYNEPEKTLTYRWKASGMQYQNHSVTIKPFNLLKIQFMVSEPPNSQLNAFLPKS
jgi:exoribonuclease R